MIGWAKRELESKGSVGVSEKEFTNWNETEGLTVHVYPLSVLYQCRIAHITRHRLILGRCSVLFNPQLRITYQWPAAT